MLQLYTKDPEFFLKITHWSSILQLEALKKKEKHNWVSITMATSPEMQKPPSPEATLLALGNKNTASTLEVEEGGIKKSEQSKEQLGNNPSRLNRTL